MTPIQYCLSKLAHLNATLFYHSDGTKIYHYEGRSYFEDEFNNTFYITPKEVRYVPNKLLKGANPDKTKKFMD